MESQKLLTVASVAQILEVSPSTVYRLIKTEELPAIKIGQRQTSVRQEDLIAYVETIRNVKNFRKAIDADFAKKHGNQGDINNKNADDTSISNDKDLTRRRFLRGSFGLVLAVTANLLGGIGASLIYEEFAHQIEVQRQLQLLEQGRVAAIERLFGGLRDFSWSAGVTHLIQDYGITRYHQSSNVIASVSLGAALGRQGQDWLDKTISTKDLPGPVMIDTDIIAVGSPVSDVIAKAGFEYIGTGYEIKRPVDPLINLPITYLYKGELGNNEVLLKRYVAGEVKEMYNWSLRMGKEMLPPPKLDANRWLQTDYLLITRIPNLLNRTAFFSGAEILIIAGTHGTGTEAIDLLLKDGSLLSRIEADRNNSPYYQVLVPIVEIVHGFDGTCMHSKPVRLGEPITKPVILDIDRIISKWAKSDASK